MSELVNVTITAPDREWLTDMTRKLVESNLAASGNLIERATSVYRWDGSVHEAAEAVVSLRTQRRHFPEIVKLVTDYHPYDVPHIVAMPIVEAGPAYADWIVESTGGQGS